MSPDPGSGPPTSFRVTVVVLCALLIGAHFLRAGSVALAVLSAAVPLTLLLRRVWAPRLLQVALGVAALEWVRTLTVLVHDRLEAGRPWLRMALILAVVAGITVWSAFLVPDRSASRGAERAAS